MVMRHCLPGRSSADRAFNAVLRPGKQWQVSQGIVGTSIGMVPLGAALG